MNRFKTLVSVAVVTAGAFAVLPVATSHAAAGARFATTPPPGAVGPDDITRSATSGVDGGRTVIWTAYQNGINADGSPGTAGGATQSTVAGYDARTGSLVETIPVTGKVDGLTADPALCRLIATVNEDNNSALNLIDVNAKTVTTYSYSPSPAVAGVGGTDSVAIWGGEIIIVHSNPSDTTQAAQYSAVLDNATLTANLTPLFFDNSNATNAITGARAPLALTDPDTNIVVPDAAPRFAGQLALISQGDGQIIFTHPGESSALTVLPVTDNVAGNVPPIDSMAVATSHNGTLYVVDAKANAISTIDTNAFPAGTVFVSEPSDNQNPLVGTLDLSTGQITPLSNTFVSPKGLLFVPR
ncbi:MAG TPA: hypothetical protein VH498_07630 [Candidatus Dormibacteraeota bacterium]|nr:hypothetical protein [Candidatus Dormibacteraeota bacterium]